MLTDCHNLAHLPSGASGSEDGGRNWRVLTESAHPNSGDMIASRRRPATPAQRAARAHRSPKGTSVWRTSALLIGLTALIALAYPSNQAEGHGAFSDRVDPVNRQIDAQPQQPEHYLRRAVLHRTRGDWTAALADLDRAAQLDPSRHEVDYQRGRVLLDANRAGEAELALRRFLAQEPDHSAARACRARALMRIGRALEAAEEFSRAIAERPTPVPDDYLDRARALAGAGDAHLEQAVRGLDEGIDRVGSVATFELLAMELELKVGHFDAALARLDRVSAHSPRQESWLARRAEIYQRAGRREEACEAFRSALAEIQKLPAHRRKTDAMTRLEARVHDALAKLAEQSR
jgi:tetratricopeptide (TPR) repeat protein